jgi:glycosyltransferase involved in cell wall biosynthesis
MTENQENMHDDRAAVRPRWNRLPTESSNKTASAPLSVTIVVCNHNRPLLLKRCLQAVQQIDYPDFSVVVVDSAPISCEAKILAASQNARYQISPVKGLSLARNVGTHTAGGDIVAYLDEDMVPHPSWLRSLVKEFADENIMAVTGPVLPLEVSGSSEGELRLALDASPWGSRRFKIDRFSPHWFERANFGGIGDGNFALRRNVFGLLPGFDESLGRGGTIGSGEEHYAFFTILKLGFCIAYVPEAIVFHPRPTVTGGYRRQLVTEAIAYGSFLAWRHPSYSWRVATYFAGGLFGRRRSWRGWSKKRTTSPRPYETASGFLCGLSDFFRFLIGTIGN